MVGDHRPREPVPPEAHRGVQLLDGRLGIVGDACVLAPGQRAVDRLTGAQDVARSSPAPLNAEEHVGLELDCLIAPCRFCSVLICAQRPFPGHASIIKRGLAHQIDLDRPAGARGGPHQRVVGILVGGRSGVRRDRIRAAARAHRQRITNDGPARWGLPRGDERVRPRFIDPVTGDSDPEWTEAETACAAVEQRAEHAGRVKPRHAQPVDGAVRGHERTRVAVTVTRRSALEQTP